MTNQFQPPFDEPPQQNPFASPLITEPAALWAGRRIRDELPAFPKTMAIIDLVFCAIRLYPVVEATLNVSGMGNINLSEFWESALFEVVTGVGILVCATAAGVGILCKQRWAVPMGWAAALFTAASAGIVTWQLAITPDVPIPDYDGTLVRGVIMGLAIRLGLLVTYLFALRNYAAWLRNRESSASQ